MAEAAEEGVHEQQIGNDSYCVGGIYVIDDVRGREGSKWTLDNSRPTPTTRLGAC